jgi:hypothetical protein
MTLHYTQLTSNHKQQAVCVLDASVSPSNFYNRTKGRRLRVS